MTAHPTRRAMLATIAAAPLAVGIAAPVLASTPTPFQIAKARYEAALARFEALHDNLEYDDPATFYAEETRLHDAIDAVEEAPTADWQEFV